MLATGNRHGIAADYWMLGIVMHEMLVGFRPWNMCPCMAVAYLEKCSYSQACDFDEPVPSNFLVLAGSLSAQARNMLEGLLDIRPWYRLSSLNSTLLMQHPYFENKIDWVSLEQRALSKSAIPALPRPTPRQKINLENIRDILETKVAPLWFSIPAASFQTEKKKSVLVVLLAGVGASKA